MSLLSLLLVACAPHDATVNASYAFYMANDTSQMLSGLRVNKRFDAQKDLTPVDCRVLEDETFRLPGADTACVDQPTHWFPWLSDYSYYLKEGKVSTDDDIYRAEALVNSEGDLQLTFHFTVPDYGEARFGWTIKPEFQPVTCVTDKNGQSTLTEVDGDWLTNWSANDPGYTVWHLNAGAYQYNPNNFEDIWSFMPEWKSGVSFGRFGDERISHHPTDFSQNGGETGDGPLYFPMFNDYDNTTVPKPGAGTIDEWAQAIQADLTENDDLTKLGSAGDFKLNYRVDSNAWRTPDEREAGLDNWVEVSLGYVRIKDFKAADIKAGKANIEGDFQLFLYGTDAPSRVFVQGTFTIDHITEVTAYSPSLEDVKMEENQTPLCK